MKFFHFINSPYTEVFQQEKQWCKNYILKNQSTFCSASLDAKVLHIQNILEEIRSSSLFQSSKVLVIYNYNAIKEEFINQILLQNEDKYIFFLEESTTPPSKLIEKFCYQNSNFSKIVHKPFGLSEREIQNWILEFLQKHSIEITAASRKFLFEWSYKHPERVELELQKFFCYTLSASGKPIEEQEIKSLFTYTEKLLPFELGETLFSGDTEKCLRLLCEYTFADPAPSGTQKYLGIVSLLLKECMIFLELANLGISDSKEQILAKYQVRGKKRTEKILEFASKFSKNQLQLHKLGIWLANFDTFLKSEHTVLSSFGYCAVSTLFFQKLILSCREK